MTDDGEQLGLATEVTVAWLANPHTRAGAEEVRAMLAAALGAIRGLDAQSSESTPNPQESAAGHAPAVTKRQSLASPDHILSMIDGTKHRSLTRHLRNHGMTPAEYRARYGLKPDYPMVAPGYSAARSAIAKQHQFGRNAAAAQQEPPTPEPGNEGALEPTAAPKRRRLGISGAKQAAKAHLGTDEADARPTPAETTAV